MITITPLYSMCCHCGVLIFCLVTPQISPEKVIPGDYPWEVYGIYAIC